MQVFASADHCPSKLVQLFDEIDLLVDGKVRETSSPCLFRSEDIL